MNLTEEGIKKALDEVSIEDIINYVMDNCADEMWEALAEDRHDL